MHYSSFRISLLFRCHSLSLFLSASLSKLHICPLSFLIIGGAAYGDGVFRLFQKWFKCKATNTLQIRPPFIVLLTPEKTPHTPYTHTHIYTLLNPTKTLALFICLCVSLHSQCGFLRFCVCSAWVRTCVFVWRISYMFCMIFLRRRKKTYCQIVSHTL